MTPPAHGPSRNDARAPRVFLGVLAAIAAGVALGARTPVVTGAADAAPVTAALDAALRAQGVERAAVTEEPAVAGPGAPARWTVALPPRATYAGVNAAIAEAVEARGGRVVDAVERGTFPDRPEALEMVLGTADAVTHRVTLRADRPFDGDVVPPDASPCIALVFDDLGYTTVGLARELLELEGPLTFSVLPGLAHSADFARAARSRGHEVILHLPMEPLDARHHDPGEDAILVDLPPAEIRRRMARNLAGVPGHVGVSNHMGSRATADADVMDLVLGEIRARGRGVFFLDSRTTPSSVVGSRARAAGVRTVANDLFLDGTDEAEVVPSVQTGQLEAIALRHGRAVGIGHVREETVAAVQEALPRWRALGIRLVPVSGLAGPGALEEPAPTMLAGR